MRKSDFDVALVAIRAARPPPAHPTRIHASRRTSSNRCSGAGRIPTIDFMNSAG